MTPETLAKLESAYRSHSSYVLGVLARRSPFIAASDRQGVYHDAFALVLEKARSGRLDVHAMNDRQLRAYLTRSALLIALDQVRWGERAHTRPLTDSDMERTSYDEPPEEQVADDSELAVLREIVAELPERRRAAVLAELDVHRGTLRALRLPEQPPALRGALRGRRGSTLAPEQVPSLVPAPFLKR
jgi:DNA-directed RNA polymerase specialized sigma24 family protein